MSCSNHQTLTVAVPRKVLRRFCSLLADESEFGDVDYSSQGSTVTARQLLVLLTYCYAVGLWDSRSIEQKLFEDDRFRSLFGNLYPDWHRLHRHRRVHHALLKHCLEEVLRSVYWYHERHCQNPQANGRCEGDLSFPVPDLSVPLHVDVTAEAERRILWAARLDSMAVDE